MRARSSRCGVLALVLVWGTAACRADGPTSAKGTTIADRRTNDGVNRSGVLIGDLTPDVFTGSSARQSVSESSSAAITSDVELLTIGAPGNQENSFPFGGFDGTGPGTRYQQAYSATQFAAAGPVLIRSVQFVGGIGDLAASTYTFSLSTITTGIDDLSTVDFDANRGADNTLFATKNLSGAAPATLVIDGSVPFFYDPSSGNLLLDIVIAPRTVLRGETGFYLGRGDAFGVFSRYHNFGNATVGWGLVTQFEVVRPTVENLIAAIDEAIADGNLTGGKRGKPEPQLLDSWRHRVEGAQRMVEEGKSQPACAALREVYRGIDGDPAPPDVVTGAAAPKLAAFIKATLQALGCRT